MEELFFRTNRETLEFINSNENESREEVLKNSSNFFGSIKTNRPNTLFQKLKDFAYQHKILKQKIKIKIMKQRKGTGKGSSMPPDLFIYLYLTLTKNLDHITVLLAIFYRTPQENTCHPSPLGSPRPLLGGSQHDHSVWPPYFKLSLIVSEVIPKVLEP